MSKEKNAFFFAHPISSQEINKTKLENQIHPWPLYALQLYLNFAVKFWVITQKIRNHRMENIFFIMLNSKVLEFVLRQQLVFFGGVGFAALGSRAEWGQWVS